MHDFQLVNCDTDSIMINKGDSSFFTKEERIALLNEINSLFPDMIRWEDDGYFQKVIVLRAKNYIMKLEDGQIKYKGSAVKATTKEPRLQQFIKDVIDSMLEGRNDYIEIYNKYVKEIINVTDIKPWASKKTITSNVLNGTRTNETNVKEAIEGTDYAEGDKIYAFYDDQDKLTLVENFKGLYNKSRLFKKLYNTSELFENVLSEGTFINYSLVRSRKLLEVL
jgi:hypothetical protein